MEDERHARISWNKHDEYLKNFYYYYTKAQNLFPMARKNHAFLVEAFDNLHEAYRQLLPYVTEKDKREKFQKQHDDLKKNIDNYSTMKYYGIRDNFGKLYYEMDDFFSELTRMAVEKSLFPPLQIDRTAKEKAESLKKE